MIALIIILAIAIPCTVVCWCMCILSGRIEREHEALRAAMGDELYMQWREDITP